MPVVFVHGFTQTGASWAPIAARLPGATTVDLPGHGSEPPATGDLWDAAARVGRAGAGHYVGYSMGGRVCLHLALARPDLVRRLVLVGATPGLEDPAARADRRAADEAMAAELETDGVDAFLVRWLAGPLFATLSAAAAGVEARRANTVDGLASALRHLGTGRQVPLWARLGELAMPVLVVVGSRDERYTAIGRRMVEAVGPGAQLAVMEHAGHACHLERPDDFVRVLRSFLTD